ncbi:hypothetical protein KW791_00395 [Candidatus Parcubacteria bacterium]|nr:hypothetical protein [Candidatus Parcubacteria bacterium]
MNWDLPPGTTQKMIDKLCQKETCPDCRYELDEEGSCAKCASEDARYDLEVDA